MAAIDFTDKG
ncbi:hypothetical protein GQ600_15146 [Phytophthora cactorum]|nr:hypothetical protein GQ600_15146 [Phytophthora cactorum]